MKEATGELNMTVITIVAIAAIAAFFYALVWPSLQRTMAKNQCASEWGVEGTAVTITGNSKDDFECTCTDTDQCSAGAQKTPLCVGKCE